MKCEHMFLHNLCYLFLIALAINIVIGTYVAYSLWDLKRYVTHVKFETRTQWNCIQRSCTQTTI